MSGRVQTGRLPASTGKARSRGLPGRVARSPEPTPDTEVRRLGAVLDFMRVLWSLDHALQSTSKRMEAQLGVTGPQRLVIRLVGRFPGVSAGALARLMRIHPSTLTGILQRLEARGALERRADPLDARRALLHLTAHGLELDALRSGTAEAGVQRVLRRLSDEQVATARGVLDTLARELDTPEAR